VKSSARKRKAIGARQVHVQPRPPVPLVPLSAALMLGGLALPAAAQTAGASQPQQLPPVTVTDERMQEGVLGKSTRVGKVAQDPHEVPQSVTTVTSKLIEEQGGHSLREALRNVSGLTFNAAEGGRSGDNMSLRGFYTFGDMYLDGIRDTAQYNRETFNLEQVDVLRGAGAMLFGRGQAGGVINQVSKTPLRRDQTTITLGAGEHKTRYAALDTNHRLTQNESLRINLMSRSEDGWRRNPASGDRPHIERDGIGISAGFNLYTPHQFWLNHYTLRARDVPDYGISFDANTRKPSERFAAETFWGIARNFDDSHTEITTGVYEWRLSPVSTLRTQVRHADYKRSYWAKTPNLTTAPDANGGVGGNQTRGSWYQTSTVQSDFSSKQTWLGMTHEPLVGIEYLFEDGFRKALQNFGTTAVPDYRPYELAVAGNPVAFKGNSYAAYVQDTVELVPGWKATLGARRDELRSEYPFNATSPRLSYGEWSWRAALSYFPVGETHYYLAWTDSFSPTADLYQLTVRPLPPERSNVVELGAKWLFGSGDWTLRTALFRATKNWERSADLESTAAVLTKKRRTDGLELELAGRITEHWEMFAGVALLDAEILEVAENVNATTGVITYANPEYKGKRPRNTPRYTVNLWTTYSFGGGWKVGGGVEAKDERYAYNPSGAGAIPTLPGGTEFYPNRAPAYERVDLMVEYAQPRYTVRLNVKNVFDELYYDSVYDNGAFAIAGPRRMAMLTTELKF
jgi:catecholate siderophore receptor